MSQLVYQDGKWIDGKDAKISIFDITVLRGFGVFDFLKTYGRKPFQLRQHVDRLYYSAEEVGLQVPMTRDEVEKLVLEGIEKTQHPDLYIKLILTGGVSDDAITPAPSKSSFILVFQKAGTYPPEQFTQGIKLMSVEHERYMPRVKSLNYMSAVVSLQKAKKIGATELLYVSRDGQLLEGGTVNFFGVTEDGTVHTSEDNVLYGITRTFLLDVAKAAGVTVVTGPINRSHLSAFREAFITSTTREVMPVTAVDDQVIGDGKVGPVTRKLMDLFSQAVKNL